MKVNAEVLRHAFDQITDISDIVNAIMGSFNFFHGLLTKVLVEFFFWLSGIVFHTIFGVHPNFGWIGNITTLEKILEVFQGLGIKVTITEMFVSIDITRLWQLYFQVPFHNNNPRASQHKSLA